LGVIQFTQYVEQNCSITKTVKFFLNGFGLRSASGGSEVQVERRLERNWSVTPLPIRRWKPAANAANFISARDERTFCVAEQAWS
jgi:hypothetical protein